MWIDHDDPEKTSGPRVWLIAVVLILYLMLGNLLI